MSSITIGRDPAHAGDVPIQGPPVEIETQEEGRWPRMLVLDEDTESRLTEYLDHEISLAWQERDLLVEDWSQWQKDYWAKPTKKVNNFPFKRASNVVIPMTAIAVEAIMARMLTTIFSIKPFFSLRPRIAPWVPAAPEIEGWLQTQVEDPDALDVDGFARESLLELVKLGTGVGKSGYERDIRKTNVDLPDGSTMPRWIERRNGPTLDYTPLANFLLRLHEKDPQVATWVGEDHLDITWAQLKRHALSGRMNPEAIEKIKAWWSQTNDIESAAQEYDTRRREQEHLEPSWKETFSFQEIWISFDVDGDGVDEEIVVDFHKDSRTLLSARYNWYKDAHRPYRIGVFIPVEGRWAGIGVGKQSEQFQALITTVHRQRLDAGTLANMGQIALKRTSGYGPDEPIFPGKMWFLENPSTDIAPFQLSNTQHFGQIQNEDAARQYADKRTGVNELILGIPTQRTPPTATSDLAKLAEGNKKFDMVLRNVRRWYSLLGLDILANYQQFGSRGHSYLVRGEKGEFVEQFLKMPQTDIRKGLYIELTVTDSITNKEVEQMKWMQLFQVLSAHYDKVLERAGQVAGILGDPQVFIMFSQMALRSSNTAMRRLLEAFGVPDIDSFLLDLEQEMRNAQSEQGGGGEPGASGGGEGAAGPSRISGLLDPLGPPGGGGVEGNGVSVDPF